VTLLISAVFTSLNWHLFPLGGKAEMAGVGLAKTGSLIEETLNLATDGIMGGSILGAAMVPMAQAEMDFTADDALENQDMTILDGSGLLAPNAISGDPFTNLKREAMNYVVQNGDNPYNIATKFGINSQTLLWANNLRDGDLIRPGDTLTILPINGVRVKIGSKDTVASLAKKYSGKAEEIIVFNDLSEDGKLAAGSFLIVPNGEMPTVAKPSTKITVPRYAQGATPLDSWLIAPASGKNWGRVHSNNGVDIAAPCGTPLYAAAAGTVTVSDGVGWNNGFGKYITIKHPNGVVTLYGHASQLLVEVGDQVAQGQLIALMGTTGRSTGCHIHFEVRGAKNPLAR